MISVKKARSEDFEKLYPLLLEFENPHLSKDDWRQLFISHCDNGEDYFGFVLFDEDEAVGFLGLIFSNRFIDGKLRKFCNMTSFIIKKEYRGKGLSRLLFSELMKLNEYTITTLPPSPKTLKMHLENGFSELEGSYRFILPGLNLQALFDPCTIALNEVDLKDNLDESELKIYKDHALCKCNHLLFKKGQESCYIIAKIIKRKGLAFAEIHYLSNPEVFTKYIKQAKFSLPLALRIWGLLMDERLLMGAKIRGSIIRKYSRPKLFKSPCLVRNEVTDNLYTESLILNI